MPNPNILFQNAPTPSLGENFRDAAGTQQAFNAVMQTPMRNRLLDAQVQGVELGNTGQQIGNDNALLNGKIAQQGLDQKTALFQIGDMARDALAIKPLIQSGNTAETLKALEMRANKIKQRGGDPSDTLDFMQRIMGGQISGEQAIQELDSVIDGAVRSGAFEAEYAGNAPSQKAFAPVPMQDEEGNFTGMGIPVFDPVSGNASYKMVGGGSAVNPITLARDKAGQSEQARLNAQLQTEPQIAADTESAVIDVQTEKKPELERRIVEARAEVEAKVAKKISEQGQLGRYSDAQTVYSELMPKGKGDVSVLNRIFGRGESLYPKIMRSQEGINALAMKDQILSMLQLGARGELKGQGPITESEQAILSKAVTILQEPDISASVAARYLDQAMELLGRNAGLGVQQPAQQGGMDDTLLEFMSPEERALFK